MQLSASFVIAALVALVSAQANPFTFTASTLAAGLSAGSPFNITWQPDSTGTITLLLKQGSSSDLNTVSTIVANTANTGSFVWTPPTSLVQGSDYALEIVDDTNTNSVNFSGEFTIKSSNTVSASASTASSTSAPSSSASSSISSTSDSSTISSSITTTSSSSTSSITSVSSKNSTATTSGTKTTSSASSSTSAAPSQTTTIASGSGMRFKVGGSMLALVGAVMLAL